MVFTKFIAILCYIFFTHNIWAYGLLRTKYGAIIQWSGSNPSQKIYLYPQNSHGIDGQTIENIFSDSVAQWNAAGKIQTSVVVMDTSQKPSDNSRNDAYFSKDAKFFSGSGVLAVTQITFQERDGAILEADILFKDITLDDNLFRGVDFVTEANSFGNPYIGGVMTHELGHLIGLGHSQIMTSSMFYVNRRGQHQIIEDDRAGANELYGKKGNTGSIFGNVIGGNQGSTVGILGSHVQVISMKRGRVVAGGFSDSDGSFTIPGLDLDDTYYLYVEPTKNLNAIPPYYSTSKRNFCSDRSSYKGSFFQSCNSSEKGYPLGIALSTEKSSIDVGNVSIKCGLDTPLDYREAKGDEFDISVVNEESLGNTFTGSFDVFDIQNQSADVINIDLEDYEISSGDYYLELKVVFQSFFSRFQMDMQVQSDEYDNTFSVTEDNVNNPILDIIARIPLDSDDEEKNNFTVTLTPQKFSTYLATSPYGILGGGRILSE